MPGPKTDLKKNRIRAFFLTLETNKKEEKEISEIQQEVEEDGMAYIQLRLPVSKITQEFEDSLKKKIQQNIISARIREATMNDLKTLKELYNNAWLTSNTPFRPIDVDSMEKILKDPDTTILIAKVYNIEGGFAVLDYEGEEKEIGVIAGLGVIPRFQRKGLGTVLGMAAWEYFKETGVEELRCEVYKDNQISYAFIKGIGFEECGKKVYRKEDFLLNG